ncbi:hypothetical protein DRQ26_06850, partial [bacterium]
AIVEVKTNKISLHSFSQILGYSKVVRPQYSFIISPSGWSYFLNRLIHDYNREDILEYYDGRKILIAKWDVDINTIRYGNVLK